MKTFPFKKIDAFATAASDGNPAGYIRLASQADITYSEMQRIAVELKGFVNEVGYVAQTSEKGFSLRYFSSEREVDFCGHATIAIMYDMIRNDPVLQQAKTLEIQTNRGVLTVENRCATEDAVFIMAPLPFEKPVTMNVREISDVLRVSPECIGTEESIAIVNAGLTTLLVPVTTLDAVLEMAPELEELKQFCIGSDVDIIEVFTGDVADAMNDYRVRVFAPRFGYLEDPATGSGNSALGYYLLNNNRFDGETIIIEQNGNRDRFNIVKIRKMRDSEKTMRILFGGGAVTRVEGMYVLHCLFDELHPR